MEIVIGEYSKEGDNMSLLELVDITFVNNKNKIIDSISVNIEKNDFVSIVGPSGSGKSTFLKILSNLISPTTGNIIFKGKDYVEYEPTDLRKYISYCFQIPYLFGSTVYDNLYFPYQIRNVKFDENRINQLFDQFNMSKEFLYKNVNNLSGGEKQRISLIRSLIFMPEVILLDEITSALDKDNTHVVENVVSQIRKEGTTVLWITHNTEQSKRYANKILTIEGGKLKSIQKL